MKLVNSTIKTILILLPLYILQPAFADNGVTNNSNKIIRLATTTSTDNSGLLAYLLPTFEKTSGYRVHIIAVGTGKALRMGRDGDADVLLVHAPAAEIKFVNAGFGEKRYPVMVNDFVLVGPLSNPANIKIDSDISYALQQIADHKSIFISRGDNSGTHKKELSLWQTKNNYHKSKAYREVGQGMGKVLQMAAELDAYTLTDRGTWLAFKAKTPLKILNEGDPKLFNPYHIIAVNPERYSNLNYPGAKALINWITSNETQTLIGQFTVNNNVLFKPSANETQLTSQLVKETGVK
ncbi:MAG: substrate-binding domain-containing protein [Gammaproteobacteria bacterium]|nr:substrate-binding domain-containing protein [Gammaproteobacteria bacterium]